jgi:dihydroneopterin aldolase
MDTVFLQGLELRSVIGVHAWERAFAQRLRLDVALTTSIQAAATSDALDDAIDYAALAETLTARARQAHYALIEALAEDLAAIALKDPRIQCVELTLYKPGALPDAQSVGVNITRSQSEDS